MSDKDMLKHSYTDKCLHNLHGGIENIFDFSERNFWANGTFIYI